MRDAVLASIGRPDRVLIDVRSREERDGKLKPPWTVPNPQGQRGGRIPEASHVPWEQLLNEDGTFKSAVELRALYEAHGVTPDKEAISYCVIGGRSNFAWFALSRLLGYRKARLDDGSWLEWGTIRGVPIERLRMAAAPASLVTTPSSYTCLLLPGIAARTWEDDARGCRGEGAR